MQIRYKTSVPTSQRTQSISMIKTNRLILQREIIRIYSEHHMKYGNTLCGRNVKLYIRGYTELLLSPKGLVLVLHVAALLQDPH
jgi:hypothetical protein